MVRRRLWLWGMLSYLIYKQFNDCTTVWLEWSFSSESWSQRNVKPWELEPQERLVITHVNHKWRRMRSFVLDARWCEPPDGIPKVGCNAKPHLASMPYLSESTEPKGNWAASPALFLVSSTFIPSGISVSFLFCFVSFLVEVTLDLAGKFVP